MTSTKVISKKIKKFDEDFMGKVRQIPFDEAFLKDILIDIDKNDLDPNGKPQVAEALKKAKKTVMIGVKMLHDIAEGIDRRVQKLEKDISKTSHGVESDDRDENGDVTVGSQVVTSPVEDVISSFAAINKGENEDPSCRGELAVSVHRQPSGREQRDSKIDSGITLSTGSVPSVSITSEINIQEGDEYGLNDLNRPPSSAGTVEESLDDNTRTTDSVRTSVAFAQALGTETQTFLERQGKKTNEYRLQKGHGGHRRSQSDG